MTANEHTPPIVRNAEGKLRRVGVELELSGLSLAAVAEAVSNRFGGCVDSVSEYELSVCGSSVGDFRIELDYEYLKSLGRERDSRVGLAGHIQRLSEQAVAEISSYLVPVEIVSPPLEPARLTDLDALVEALRLQGGRGTQHSALYAFGLHLNPEVPALDAALIVRYIQSFLCAYEWLVTVENVDWTRRITPYIDPFPRSYASLVLDNDYAPDLDTLISDYLAHNAVRNRALDMLPLFAYLDEDRVRESIDDPRIKARPTFHYRLPNCDVDIPGWAVSSAWRNWLEVERIAEQTDILREMSDAYLEHLSSTTTRLTADWVKRFRTWLC